MQDDPTYNATFDYARLIAVIGIIWFHAKAPGGAIGYSGLAFFLMLLVHNGLPQVQAMRPLFHRAPAWTRYAVMRARRLLLPWVWASAVYGGLKLLDVISGSPLKDEFTADMWLTGPAVHLWFLPFAFLVSIALWPLGRWLRDQSGLGLAGCALGSLSLALVLCYVVVVVDVPVPFAQWTYALPVIAIGITLSISHQDVTQTLALLAFFVLSALSLQLTEGLLEITLAGVLMTFCMWKPLPGTAFSRWCGRMSLWIYLVHPAVMTLYVRGAGVPEGALILPVMVTATTVLLVALTEAIARSRFAPLALRP